MLQNSSDEMIRLRISSIAGSEANMRWDFGWKKIREMNKETEEKKDSYARMCELNHDVQGFDSFSNGPINEMRHAVFTTAFCS